MITGSDDHTIKVYDRMTGTEVNTFTGHTGPIKCLKIFPGTNGRIIISGSSDNTIKIWDRLIGKCLDTLIIPNIISEVTSIAVSIDQKICIANKNGQIMIYKNNKPYNY